MFHKATNENHSFLFLTANYTEYRISDANMSKSLHISFPVPQPPNACNPGLLVAAEIERNTLTICENY